MKKYIPKPGVPKPTPSPDGKKKGDGRVYAGGPNFRELNPRVKPKPEPTPKPNPGKDDGRKTIMPVGPKKPRSNDTIKAKFKPDGTRVLTTNPRGKITKRRDVSDEQLVPRRVKPTPNRRRFLEQLNEMNKKSR